MMRWRRDRSSVNKVARWVYRLTDGIRVWAEIDRGASGWWWVIFEYRTWTSGAIPCRFGRAPSFAKARTEAFVAYARWRGSEHVRGCPPCEREES